MHHPNVINSFFARQGRTTFDRMAHCVKGSETLGRTSCPSQRHIIEKQRGQLMSMSVLPIQVGIVGLGRIGHLRRKLIDADPRCKLVGVCDIAFTEDNSPPLANMMTTDFHELLAADLDGVFVCTPNAVTPDVVVEAMSRGVHVFCEKPPGRCAQDIERIRVVEAAQPSLKLKFGFNHRYHESVREAVGIIGSGQMGKLLWMRGVYGKSGGFGFEHEWRSQHDLAGGGILLDQGIHMLDLFRLFAGEFVDVKSYVDTLYWPIDVEDNAFALLRNESGQVAMIHSSSTHWRHNFQLELFLSEGYLIIRGLLTSSSSYGRETLIIGHRQFEDGSPSVGSPHEDVVYFDQDVSWQREINEFVTAIDEDKQIEIGTSWDALQVMRLIEQIYSNDAKWSQRLPFRETTAP